MEFICNHVYQDGEKKSWPGTIRPVAIRKDTVEAIVSGRGSCFTIIIGGYQNGHFLCIPDLDVGCPLAGWEDTFWNNERLAALMNETDAATVVAGVKALMGKKSI